MTHRSPSPRCLLDVAGPHSLLEPPSPAYSNVTVRRAFIVWMYCGQQNKFKDVCNYYHYLEELEDQLPADKRAMSRHHEFNLFSNPPSTSRFLQEYFPKLYYQGNSTKQYIRKVEAIRNDACIFKLEGFHEIKRGVAAAEIVETSEMIRRYCQSHLKPLRKFLQEFKSYTKKCHVSLTVRNVANYIKRKLIIEELFMIVNRPRTFSFLSTSSEGDCGVDSVADKWMRKQAKPAEKPKDKKNILKVESKNNDFTNEILMERSKID